VRVLGGPVGVGGRVEQLGQVAGLAGALVDPPPGTGDAARVVLYRLPGGLDGVAFDDQGGVGVGKDLVAASDAPGEAASASTWYPVLWSSAAARVARSGPSRSESLSRRVAL
jgi:hypothetical protein